MVVYGRISSFLAVIDPNPFGLVKENENFHTKKSYRLESTNHFKRSKNKTVI